MDHILGPALALSEFLPSSSESFVVIIDCLLWIFFPSLRACTTRARPLTEACGLRWEKSLRFVVACGGTPYFGAPGVGFTRDRSHLEADASSKTVKHLMLTSSHRQDMQISSVDFQG
jgi:hypothetical protein